MTGVVHITPEHWSAFQHGPISGPAYDVLLRVGFRFETTAPTLTSRRIKVMVYIGEGQTRRLMKTIRTAEELALWSSGVRDAVYAIGANRATPKEAPRHAAP